MLNCYAMAGLLATVHRLTGLARGRQVASGQCSRNGMCSDADAYTGLSPPRMFVRSPRGVSLDLF